jgi:hypothetical protein
MGASYVLAVLMLVLCLSQESLGARKEILKAAKLELRYKTH